MDVFDSSVWLWGLLTDDTETNRLIDEGIEGDREVAVSAYIHDEVTSGLTRADGVTRQDISDSQMKFNATIANQDNISTSQSSVLNPQPQPQTTAVDGDERRRRRLCTPCTVLAG